MGDGASKGRTTIENNMSWDGFLLILHICVLRFLAYFAHPFQFLVKKVTLANVADLKASLTHHRPLLLPAPRNPPPAFSHPRSTEGCRKELSPHIHLCRARHPPPPPLLNCYRICAAVEIDPGWEFLSLVRNPNLVGWDFHLRRSPRD
jgi:hypothetical protein